MLHVLSTLVLVLIIAGLWYRKHRRIHIPIMATAFVADVALLLYIELTRHAVKTVVLHGRWLIYVHAALSLGVLGCYVAMFLLGRKVVGTGERRLAHRNVGMTFVALRGSSYATALML